MRIDCYISAICTSREPLRKNIDEALGLEAVDAEVVFSIISELQASSLGLRGSPSILINGADIQPVETTGFS
jgi:hypothetical protein